MAVVPIQIERKQAEGIEITWSDGSTHALSSKVLRTNCPCAGCKEARGDTTHQTPLTGKKSLLKVISSSRDEELRLQRIWAVGQYALGMEWADGHANGIYTFELLRELGAQQTRAA